MSILDDIMRTKHDEVERLKKQSPLARLKEKLANRSCGPRFIDALKSSSNGLAVIAELKRKSPSKGVLCEDYDPVRIAKQYETNGASALSVLTDETYFDGKLSYIGLVRDASRLPILRKDFIIDSYQIYESAVAGANAVLLLANVLDDAKLKQFGLLANDLSLDALIEVHTQSELSRVLSLKPDPQHTILGINNRDLRSFRTDLKVTESLAGSIPKAYYIVSESGIHTHADLIRLKSLGVHAVLVGEGLITNPDPGRALRELLG